MDVTLNLITKILKTRFLTKSSITFICLCVCMCVSVCVFMRAHEIICVQTWQIDELFSLVQTYPLSVNLILWLKLLFNNCQKKD